MMIYWAFFSPNRPLKTLGRAPTARSFALSEHPDANDSVARMGAAIPDCGVPSGLHIIYLPAQLSRVANCAMASLTCGAASSIAKCPDPWTTFASDFGTDFATASIHGVVIPGCIGIRLSSELR
jgi:hypothetical protein